MKYRLLLLFLIQIIGSTSFAVYDFEGTIAMPGCSGALVRLEHSKDDDNALILTNGHCLESGDIPFGQIVLHQSSAQVFQIYNSHNQRVGPLTAQELIFATMTKTDVAIYKLHETYGEVKEKLDATPLLLSPKHPDIGSSVDVLSGYWARGSTCSIEAFVHQLEEGAWTWSDSMRLSSTCTPASGSSGSPLILEGTRTVVGISNTSNESGEMCTDNNPCEIDSQGNKSIHQSTKYGQQTFWIYNCLNQNNEIDLKQPGCSLP